MLTVEQAQARVLALARPVGAERCWIDAALGRVLAEDLRATRAQPPADNSAMDGYAMLWSDVAHLASDHGCGDEAEGDHGVLLTVVSEIPAGSWSDRILEPGEAAKIMTGAPLPPGDGLVVVMREWTDERGDTVLIKQVGAGVGHNIRNAGEDLAEGATYLEAGRVLQPPDLALLASQGVTQVTVRRQPVVGIISTGDEVHEPGNPLPRGHIWNSNAHALGGLVREAGATPRYLGIARDSMESLREVFSRVEGCDAVISIGGVSVGDYDFVKDVLAELGGEQEFWKVAMRPGKPNASGTLAGMPYFGLPGNPVSSMVSFMQFVRPALLKMQGRNELFLETVDAELEHELSTRKRFLFLVRGVLKPKRAGLGYTVSTTGPQGSGIMRSLSLANCLVAVPEDIDKLPAGARVRVQLLPWTRRAQAESALRQD